MRPRQAIPVEVIRLAAAQEGVVSREQALRLGISRHVLHRLSELGVWRPVTPGIFITHSAPPTWKALAWSGVLLGGDRARLGGTAAAHLHRIEPAPEQLTILIPHQDRVQSRDCWTFQRERPGVRAARSVGDPPRTTLEDTILDLCATATPADVVDWLTKAVQTRRTSAARLRRALDARVQLGNRGLLVDLLSEVAAGAHSPLEVHYLRDVERTHGLPIGRRQASHRGLPYVSDVLYDDYQLLVELDGRAGHEGTGAFRDMSRDNALALTGKLTLRYGWWHITGQPCRAAWQVAEVLVNRGWPGYPAHCSNCARAA